MDAKELSLIAKLHGRITAGSFAEADVLSLLVLLRPLAAVGSAVFAFAHFIAHREKDRGSIRAYLHQAKRTLDRLEKKNGALDIKPVFSTDAIGASINYVLQQTGLSPFGEGQITQILVCIMSLLQDVRILDRKGRELGRLVLAHTASELQLLGKVWMQNKTYAMFPVLIVPNHAVPGLQGDMPAPTILVEVSVCNGQLRFMPVTGAATSADPV